MESPFPEEQPGLFVINRAEPSDGSQTEEMPDLSAAALQTQAAEETPAARFEEPSGDEDLEKLLATATRVMMENSNVEVPVSGGRPAEEKQEEENAAQENAAEEEPETADASTDSVDAVTGDETAAEQQPDLTEETLPETEEPEAADASAQRSILPELNFSEETVLQAPVNGQVLIDYSMDSTVYFPTLNVYKYNPAVIISAAEGEQVLSAANGRVTSITQDEETGRTVTMDLGNGYEAIYGQLQEVNLEDYVPGLKAMLARLEQDYHYNRQDAFLVLKDILAQIWNGKAK